MIDFQIWIVSHEEDRQTMMIGALREHFKVKGFLKGADAIAALSAERCDLMLIDFNIADMSALGLQQTVQKDYSQVHCALITAIDRSKCVIESMRKRAMDYIYKTDDPVRFGSDVCKLVRFVVDTKQFEKTENALKETGLYSLIADVYEKRTLDIDDLKRDVEELRKRKRDKK